MLLRNAISSLLISALGLVSVWSAPPPVAPGFPHDQSFVPGQLLYREIGMGRTANIVYHNGNFYTNNVGGGEQTWWSFADPSDISTFGIAGRNMSSPTGGTHGNHGGTKSGDYAGGFFLSMQRLAPGVNDHTEAGFMPVEDIFSDIQLNSERSSNHVIYYPWSVPFTWLQYTSVPGAGRIWRADEMLVDWEPLADHGVAGNSILVGNLLFITSDGSMLGVLAYDISPIFNDPPEEPRLLDKFSGNVGGYLGSVWENYLILTGADADDSLVYVIDYSDPTNLQLVRTLDLSGGAPGLGLNIAYAQTQDEYLFTQRHKVNMETFESVLSFDEIGTQRPAGSAAGPLDISQFMLPVGNLMVTGAYSTEGADGVGVWCHQAEPDTRSPYVGYHVPRPGQTNFPLGAPISLLIAETLESYTIINGDTIIVRPLGGTPIDCWTSFSYDGILTITPKEYFAPDTTYEVVVVDGGIKDAAGNGIEGYTFTFSTGGNLSGGNAPPEILNFDAEASPIEPGQTTTFTASASDAEGDPIEYRFNFGDGSDLTDWSIQASASHTYTIAGHFSVKVQARDLKPDSSTSVSSDTMTVTVVTTPQGPAPTNSSPIALDTVNRKVWVANPDNDSVSRIDADTHVLDLEVNLRALLGADEAVTPKNVAIGPSGSVWVTCHAADRILVLDSGGALVQNIHTGYGSAPMGVAIAADGARAYVSLYGRGASDAGNGQLLQFDTTNYAELNRLELGPTPHAIAVSSDGSAVYVSRFISGPFSGSIWHVDTADLSLASHLTLSMDPGRFGLDKGGSKGNGVPNYVSSLTIAPQEDWMWYGALKNATSRGLFFDQNTGNNLPLSHDTTIRSFTGRVDLDESFGPFEPSVAPWATERIDIDNSESPSAMVFSPAGDYAFVAMQGNNSIMVFDDLAIREGVGRSTTWRIGTGAAPQGLVFDSQTNELWVKNFLSRDVTVIPLDEFLAAGERNATPQTIATVTGSDRLSDDVLAGKQVFYFAGDAMDGQNGMSFEGYISCASCHVDGRQDGRIWDFTQRGEGLRNTTDLRGRAGMGQGNVHWSGNFDEIEDFILDITGEFGGDGFLEEGQSPNPSLGASNRGLAEEIDNLASYVTSLDTRSLPRSPYRNTDGAMTESAVAGAQVFQDQNCASCHDPSRGFTDSELGNPLLHNVGTLRSSSGQRLGEALLGVDTPTLQGIWDSAPYFHDGSASTIDDVFTVAGGVVLEAEWGTLAGAEIVSGGNAVFNWESTAQGDFVDVRAFGGTITFSGVDGGDGGLGALEIRYNPMTSGTMRIRVNGTHTQDLDYPMQASAFEWHRARFEEVPLVAGLNNTVVIERVSGGRENDIYESFLVDNLTISIPNELSAASAHRNALNLDDESYDNLVAYLLQLDGRDESGTPPANLPPVALNDRFETPVDETIVVTVADLLSNDIDSDGDPLSILAISSATGGIASWNGVTGEIAFVPDSGFVGDGQFQYTLSDGNDNGNPELQSLGTVIIAVGTANLNTPPVGTNDAFSTFAGVPLTISVADLLSNDTDIDGDALTLLSTEAPVGGVVTLNLAAGEIVFTPSAGYIGEGGFTYALTDGHDGGDPTLISNAQVIVTVEESPPGDGIPFAVDDRFTTEMDVALTISIADLLSNDSDPNGDPLSIIGIDDAINGSFAWNQAAGEVTFTPDTGFIGEAQFTYTLSDGNDNGDYSLMSWGQVYITVVATSLNTPPSGVDDSYSMYTNNDLRISVSDLLSNDTDADGEALTILSVDNFVNGFAILDTAAGEIVFTPDAGFVGEGSFTYSLTDGHDGGDPTLIASAQVTITVNASAANHIPIAVDDAFTAPAGVPLHLSVAELLSNDIDADGDILSILFIDDWEGGVASLDTEAGTIVFTPNVGFIGDGRFTYTLSDGLDGGDYALMAWGHVTMTFENRVPNGVDDTFTTTMDTPLTITVDELLSNDTDENGDTLSILFIDDWEGGVASLNSDTGEIIFTPNASFSGEGRFTYTLSDGHDGGNYALMSWGRVTISVGGASTNTPPVGVDDAFATAPGAALTLSVSELLSNDSDADGDALSLVSIEAPVNGIVTLNLDDDKIVFTPDVGFVGESSFTYTLTDGHDGGIASAQVTVTVEAAPGNHVPFGVNDAFTTQADLPLTISVAELLSNDVDLDGDELVLLFIDDWEGGVASLDSEAGKIVFTPNIGFEGDARFTYTLTDGHDGGDYALMAWGQVTIAVSD